MRATAPTMVWVGRLAANYFFLCVGENIILPRRIKCGEVELIIAGDCPYGGVGVLVEKCDEIVVFMQKNVVKQN